ncbi:unnamed protein product [Paramecium sonneborni]|uniref:Uncharacterized protein n=1 Tax=Paramecium sonneborni TaxID=65129 RepID=A0A8S1RKT3_9CILI|nr:unnamed protein product [Paramecium sonneborni]
MEQIFQHLVILIMKYGYLLSVSNRNSTNEQNFFQQQLQCVQQLNLCKQWLNTCKKANFSNTICEIRNFQQIKVIRQKLFLFSIISCINTQMILHLITRLSGASLGTRINYNNKSAQNIQAQAFQTQQNHNSFGKTYNNFQELNQKLFRLVEQLNCQFNLWWLLIEHVKCISFTLQFTQLILEIIVALLKHLQTALLTNLHKQIAQLG